MSPLTTLQSTSNEDEAQDNTSLRRQSSTAEISSTFTNSELLDTSKRMNYLFELYAKLPVSYLKSKVSFTLGHYATFILEDFKLAEQLFFESIYLLDLCKGQIYGVPPIVSELGTNILLRYSEVLLTNFKYLYAIASYESALVLYKQRNKPGLFSFLRRLASITQDNEDNKRAIHFYKEVIELYYKANKINETRYVAEMLSTLYLEEADFRKSESNLIYALNLLPENQDKMDPITFRLNLKLADVYLYSYHQERGILLLEKLKHRTSGQNKQQVLVRLVQVYTKKRWFKECTDTLREFQGELNSAAASASFVRGVNSPLIDKSKLFELYAKYYFHCHLYIPALACVDMCVTQCSNSNYSTLAKLYFLRGKIFQALCNSSTTLTFPTALKVNNANTAKIDEFLTTFTPPANSPASGNKIFTCTGDLIQECISSYDKAYSYYRIIGDDVNIAKTTSRISTTYLERLFSPHALLNINFADLARLPYFEVSEIAKVEKKAKKGAPIVTEPPKEFVITFERIENPCICAMDISANTYNPIIMSKCYLNMAELKYLKGDLESGIAYWTQCKELLSQLYIDGVHLLGKAAPSNFLRKLFELWRRVTRFLFCLDSETILKHLNVIDTYLLLQLDLEQSIMRTIKPSEGNTLTHSTSSVSSTGSSESLSSSTSSAGGLTSSDSVETRARSGSKSSNVAPPPSSRASTRMSGMYENTATPEVDQMKKKSEMDEGLALLIWGHMHAIQLQIGKYIKGKLTSEELITRNRTFLKRVFHFRQLHETYKDNNMDTHVTSNRKRLHQKMSIRDMTSGSKDDDEALRTIPSVIYALEIEDYIIYYTPNTGHKRIQRLGGKEEQFSVSAPQAITSLYLNIHLLRNTEEFVTLQVSPTLTLDRIIRFLCNKPYWEVDDKRGTSLLRTLGRNTQNYSSLRHKPKFMDRTKQFHPELVNLLALLGYTSSSPSSSKMEQQALIKENRLPITKKGLTATQLSQIAFAKKTVNPYDSVPTYIPLTVSTSTTVAQCFNQQEMTQASGSNPLDLYLYLSSNSLTELTPSASQQAALNKTMFITEDVLAYLSYLVVKEHNEDPEFTKQCRKALSDMTDAISTTIEELVPNAQSKGLYTLALIASKSLQIFPWELLVSLPQYVLVRYFSLEELKLSPKKKIAKGQEEPPPNYYSFYYSGIDKAFFANEDHRRELLVDEAFHQLNLKAQSPSCIRNSTILAPFHSSLVKPGKKLPNKRKYTGLSWFDLATVSNDEQEVLQVIGNTVSYVRSPIFILSYADLLETSTLLLRIMRQYADCVFLFVPSTKMKIVVSRLSKMQEDLLKPMFNAKNKTGPTQFTGFRSMLIATLRVLQAELNIPIATFNLGL